VRTPLRDSDRSDREKADHLVAAFRVLLPAVTALVEHHFRRVLLAVAQEHLESVGEAHEIAAVTAETPRPPEARPPHPHLSNRRPLRSGLPTRRRASSKTCSTASRRATTSSTGS